MTSFPNSVLGTSETGTQRRSQNRKDRVNDLEKQRGEMTSIIRPELRGMPLPLKRILFFKGVFVTQVFPSPERRCVPPWSYLTKLTHSPISGTTASEQETWCARRLGGRTKAKPSAWEARTMCKSQSDSQSPKTTNVVVETDLVSNGHAGYQPW